LVLPIEQIELLIRFTVSRNQPMSSKAISSSSPTDKLNKISCRIAVIGSNQVRLAKVIALLSESLTVQSAQSSSAHASSCSTTTNNNTSCSFIYTMKHDQKDEEDFEKSISVEYLPCLATFDSYKNDHNETIEYLTKVEYHGYHGKMKHGSSLAPFFDATTYTDDTTTNNDEEDADKILLKEKNLQPSSSKQKRLQVLHFSGIAGVVIGCGIESSHQVQMIESFVQSLSVGPVVYRRRRDSLHDSILSESDTGINTRNLIQPVLLDYLQCNMESFHSLVEENEAFRNLSEEEKKLATKLGTMGPGKMVHLIHSVKESILASYRSNSQALQQRHHLDETTATNHGMQISSTEDSSQTSHDFQIRHVQEHSVDKIRFACKLCRTYLFSMEDLEDPPHFKSKHDFRNRKGGKGGGSHGDATTCESLFLSVALSWMGTLSDTEGKLACPKCLSKVGQWNWSGTQCSCGTWVTPAIQIPRSRVDMIYPQTKHHPNARNTWLEESDQLQ